MFTELFPELQMAKLRLDKETKRLLIGQLMIDTKMNKNGVCGFINQLIVDTDEPDSYTLEDYLKFSPEGLDKVFDAIGEAMSFMTKNNTEGSITICKGRFKIIIYGAMKAQAIFNDYIIKKSPRASKIWVHDLNGDNMSVVSAYSWKMAERMFPELVGTIYTSLVKIDMDEATMERIDSLIRWSPWKLILPHVSKNITSAVVPKELYVPNEWATIYVQIAEHLLKEEDIRILKLYNKEVLKQITPAKT
jgi:hypothetical protein